MMKGFDGREIKNTEQFLDFISDNAGMYDWNSEKLEAMADEYIQFKEKADKYDQYQRENWIAIPRKDFDCVRKEEKEQREENKRLKEIFEEIKDRFNPEFYDSTAPEDSVQACLEIRDILETKEGTS